LAARLADARGRRRRNNRQLHKSEAEKLAALKQGKSTAAQHRLDAAACALVQCAEGVPTSDEQYAKLKALQTEGQSYNDEQLTLKSTGEFVSQPYLDRARDALTSHAELIRRTGGAINLGAGAVGIVGGGVIAGGGTVTCAETLGLGCAVGAFGAYIATASNQQAQQGSQALFGQFQSSEGQRVLSSFNVSTFPGEKDPLANAGLDVLKLGAVALAGKFIPKALASAEESIAGVGSAGAKASAVDAKGGAAVADNAKIVRGSSAVEGGTAAAGSTLRSAATTGRSLTAPNGSLVDLPEAASMSNVEVRQWYLNQEARIPELIDSTALLEQQARQAVDLRNVFRSAARNAMADQEAAAMLRTTNPNLTWDQVVHNYSANYSGNELFQQIIAASQRSRPSVNQAMGVTPPGKKLWISIQKTIGQMCPGIEESRCYGESCKGAVIIMYSKRKQDLKSGILGSMTFLMNLYTL
jgi:hypothetical protein